MMFMLFVTTNINIVYQQIGITRPPNTSSKCRTSKGTAVVVGHGFEPLITIQRGADK